MSRNTDDEEPPIINLEIFSCAGGMAEGFRRAGVTFDMAVDMAEDHVASYERNLGHRPVRMDARDLLRMVKLGWRIRVGLLVADPPCTPWSRAGKRKGTVDERDMLHETAELISVLRPHAYLIGNVPGLEDANNLSTVQDVIGGLSRHGYCVADFAALDAANYGVPQHRIRPFWYGHLHGPCIQWPIPTHGDPAKMQATLPGVDELQPWITCGQALGHLTPKELGRMVRLRKRDCNTKQHGSIQARPARVVGTSNLSDGNVLLPAAQNGHQPHQADKPAHAILSSSGRGAPGVLQYGANHPPSYIDEPAMVQRGGCGGGATRALQLSPRTSDIEHAHHVKKPARTVTAAGRGNQAMVVDDGGPRHPPARLDAPAPTLLAKQRGNGGQMLSLDTSSAAPQSQRVLSGDAPATAVQVREDRQGKGMMVWPWNTPSTTLTTRNQQPPPGRNGRAKGPNKMRSHPKAVLLSERAATILQGFPETWVFVGATKKARWGQIGQAMPPPLAEAVGRAVVQQIANTTDTLPGERFVPWVPPRPRVEAPLPVQMPLLELAPPQALARAVIDMVGAEPVARALGVGLADGSGDAYAEAAS